MSARLTARPRPFTSNATTYHTSTPKPRYPYIPAAREDVSANNDGRSSIYSIPDDEAINTISDQQVPDKGAIARESARSLRREQPVRVVTRKGKILCADGFSREQEGPPRTFVQQPIWRSKDGFRWSYNHRRNAFILPRTPAAYETRFERLQSGLDLNIHHECAILDDDKSQYIGRHLVKDPDLSHIHPAHRPKFHEESIVEPRPLHEVTVEELFSEPVRVPASRFVVSEDKINSQPTRRPSLVRRLSDSVKGRFSGLSGSSQGGRPHVIDANDGKRKDRGLLPPEVKLDWAGEIRRAVPRRKTAAATTRPFDQGQRVRDTIDPVRPDLVARIAPNKRDQSPLRDNDIHTSTQTQAPRPVVATPSFAERRAQVRVTVSTSSPALGGKARTVKGIGHPDRDTRWSYFMDGSKFSTHPSQDDSGRAIPKHHLELAGLEKSLPTMRWRVQPEESVQGIQVHDLHAPHPVSEEDSVASLQAHGPAKKESLRKRVDTSRKSWMPPDRGQSIPHPPTHKQATSHRSSQVARTEYFDMTPSFPSINDLFDPIDAIIDVYAQLGDDKESVNHDFTPGHSNTRGVRSQYRRRQEELAGRGRGRGADAPALMARMDNFTRMRERGLDARGKQRRYG